MNNIEKYFSSFINYALKFFFALILLGSLAMTYGYFLTLSQNNTGYFFLTNAILIAFGSGVAYLIYKYYRTTNSPKKTLLLILTLSFTLRLLWILSVDTQPFSDFDLIYQCGGLFAKGETWFFKGTSYMARFTHLTALTIYLGLFQKLFTNALLMIKLVNVILSTANVLLLYLISSELYSDKKKSIITAVIACLFPPFIIYNSVPCSENLAIPFFLLSVYIFLLVINKKKNMAYLLSVGIILSTGNLFRMVGIVMLIAFIIYLIVYRTKEKLLRSCALLLIGFIVPLYLTSIILIKSDITEYPLWKGREPNITSVLKGTNLESGGMWNEADSKIPEIYNYDYKAVEKASMEIIKERLTNTPLYKLVIFYTTKFIKQWSVGDFSALDWADGKIGEQNTITRLSVFENFYSQLFYVLMMLLVYLGLFNKKAMLKNKAVNLFYILFCGYGLFYLLTEMQPRYAYTASWILLLLTCSGDSSLAIGLLGKLKLRKSKGEYSVGKEA